MENGGMVTGKPAASGKCAMCGGSMSSGKMVLPLVFGERVLTIRDVPAEICDECGEAFLESAAVDVVQKMAADFEALDAEVSVARYRAA